MMGKQELKWLRKGGAIRYMEMSSTTDLAVGMCADLEGVPSA